MSVVSWRRERSPRTRTGSRDWFTRSAGCLWVRGDDEWRGVGGFTRLARIGSLLPARTATQSPVGTSGASFTMRASFCSRPAVARHKTMTTAIYAKDLTAPCVTRGGARPRRRGSRSEVNVVICMKARGIGDQRCWASSAWCPRAIARGMCSWHRARAVRWRQRAVRRGAAREPRLDAHGACCGNRAVFKIGAGWSITGLGGRAAVVLA
jgi:hypothetical protein